LLLRERLRNCQIQIKGARATMCNLYSITTNQAAIIALFRVINRYVGNLSPMPGVFPDYPAPLIRNTDAGRELAHALGHAAAAAHGRSETPSAPAALRKLAQHRRGFFQRNRPLADICSAAKSTVMRQSSLWQPCLSKALNLARII
jgi:hypothetical protein